MIHPRVRSAVQPAPTGRRPWSTGPRQLTFSTPSGCGRTPPPDRCGSSGVVRASPADAFVRVRVSAASGGLDDEHVRKPPRRRWGRWVDGVAVVDDQRDLVSDCGVRDLGPAEPGARLPRYPSTQLVLAKAVYLKAAWLQPFVPAQTKPAAFRTSVGASRPHHRRYMVRSPSEADHERQAPPAARGSAGVVRRCLWLPGSLGANNDVNVATLMLVGMLAGADSIDDLDVLRSGATGRLWGAAKAPSTIGTWLRSCTYCHRRQLDLIARQLLIVLGRGCRPAPVGRADNLDCDSTVLESHGLANGVPRSVTPGSVGITASRPAKRTRAARLARAHPVPAGNAAAGRDGAHLTVKAISRSGPRVQSRRCWSAGQRLLRQPIHHSRPRPGGVQRDRPHRRQGRPRHRWQSPTTRGSRSRTGTPSRRRALVFTCCSSIGSRGGHRGRGGDHGGACGGVRAGKPHHGQLLPVNAGVRR